MIKVLIGLILFALAPALASSVHLKLSDYVGKEYGREGLPGFKTKRGLAALKHESTQFSLTFGTLQDSDVLMVSSVVERNKQGQVTKYRVADMAFAPKLEKGQAFAKDCKGRTGALRGTSGVVQLGDPPGFNHARATKLFQISSDGHLKEIKADDAVCSNPEWGI